MITRYHCLHFTPSLKLLSFQRDNIKSNVNYNWSVTGCKSCALGHILFLVKTRHSELKSMEMLIAQTGCHCVSKWEKKFENWNDKTDEIVLALLTKLRKMTKSIIKCLNTSGLTIQVLGKIPKSMMQKIKHSFDRDVSQLILMPFLSVSVIKFTLSSLERDVQQGSFSSH